MASLARVVLRRARSPVFWRFQIHKHFLALMHSISLESIVES
jgi:hypothetical protein